MCGFHGSSHGRSIGEKALAHRGPDHYGIFRDGNVVLEHWRLSIIDLSSKGNQPMSLDDGSSECVIAYNGEVYNFNDLKAALPCEQYQSSTDTEVILRLYQRYGVGCLPKLDGMFSLAIYDKAKRQIVLARDRFGIKPLYYHIDSDSNLTFASELKALILHHSIELSLDLTAIQSLFHLLYIEGERTPFQQIRKLAPGSCLVYDLQTKRVQISKYHEFEFGDESMSEKRCIRAIDELLSESVRMHLISDVPVGALLSGGVDSSLMVAMMSKYSDTVHSYSVGHSGDALFDEARYFNLVANKYRTDHHHTNVDQAGLQSLVEGVCRLLDEPVGDTSVFLNYFIFGFVAKTAKVCLSGLGGDELFGGYNRHLACKLLPVYTGMPRAFRRGIESLIEFLPSSRQSGVGNKIRLVKTFLQAADDDLGRSYCRFIDYFWNCGAPVLATDDFRNTRFDACWDEELVDRLDRIYKYDIENYMANDLLFLTDRMSMQHSLEVRVPYLENGLVDFALKIAPRQKIKGFTMKYLLKKVAERYVPKEVIYRRKVGFSAPVAGLFQPATLDALQEQLLNAQKEYVRILNRPLFVELISRHRAGREDYSLQIFTLFVYLKWMEECFAQR